MAIDPAELEGLDEEGVRALYEERLQQQQSTASREVSLLWCGRCSTHPAPCRSRFTWLQGAPRAAAGPRILRGPSLPVTVSRFSACVSQLVQRA